MPENNQIKPELEHQTSFIATIPIQACRLKRDELKRLYGIINAKQMEYRERILAQQFRQPNETEEQFENRVVVVRNAFVTSVVINGANNESIVGNNENIFDHQNLPSTINSIFFTTTSAPQTVLKHIPTDNLTLLLDFNTPTILNLTQLPSLPTPNTSNITINAVTEQWFSSVKARITEFFEERKTGYDFLHRAGVYDFFLFAVGFPLAIWVTVRTTTYIKGLEKLPVMSQALIYVYLFFATLLLFRFAFSYARWAFPKVEVVPNLGKYQSTHRVILGAIILAITASAIYDIAKQAFF